PTIVRIGVALATLFPPTSLIALLGYVVLEVLLPEEGNEHLPGRERVQRNLAGLREDVSGLTDTVRTGLRRGPRDLPEAPGRGEPPVPADEAIDRAATSARRYES